jgi:diphthamide synthase (EF-2-diphthine--ammonia ligase)
MWSGGKDSALALQRARSAGLDVELLCTFFEAASLRVRFHATRVEMIEAQAAVMRGVKLAAIGTNCEAMEMRLDDQLRTLRSDGFAGVVFGDIHLADVRAWFEARVTAAGLEHIEPIWAQSPTSATISQWGNVLYVTC